MPGETMGSSHEGVRFRSTMGAGGEVEAPGELRIHESLRSTDAETTPVSRLRINVDGSGPATAEAGEAGTALAEILSAGEYALTERDGHLFAVVGEQEADITALFGNGHKLDRYKPVDVDNPRGDLAHTETVEITGLSRGQSGSRAGELRVQARRGNGMLMGIGLDEIGRRDPDGRTWRLPLAG